jgi:hypothetical protein
LTEVFAPIEKFYREIIGLPIPTVPTRLSAQRKRAATEHWREEISEFETAETLEDEIDACLDLGWLAFGRVIEMGADIPAHWAEIVRANGTRVRGQSTKRVHSLGFDAVKPEGWVGPGHSRVLYGPKPCVEVVPPYHFLGEDAETLEPKKKIILLGYGRHGKDTVAEMLRDRYGYKFESSSKFLAERVIMPHFDNPRNSLLPYENAEACFEDRHNYRALWYDLISAYNFPDKSRLARELFEVNDIYVGLRAEKELQACKSQNIADLIIWVDASNRLPAEDTASCTVARHMADVVIFNNGTLEDLAAAVDQFALEEGL